MGTPRWPRRVLAKLRAFGARRLGSEEAERVAPYDLGELPPELRVRWPARPVIHREVVIAHADELEGRWTEPNTRLHIRADLDWLIVGADDVEVVVEDKVYVDRVFVEQGRKRVRFVGGMYGQVELQIPGRHLPPPEEWRERWLIEDVIFERVTVLSEDESAFLLRGRRVAIVDSVVEAARSAVRCGDAGRFGCEDVILAGSRLESEGEPATVHLADVSRAVVVDCWLGNLGGPNLGVHGRSDLVHVARNTLVDAGVELASEPGDALGAVWLADNAIHGATGRLLLVDEARVRRLELTGNEVLGGGWSDLWCDPVPAGWVVERNLVSAYRAPSPKEARP